MGFSKDKAPSTIPIPMTFEVEGTDRDGNEILYDEQVVHYFTRPTTAQRERLADALTPARGRRSPRRIIQATYDFWATCCVRVEGYDDLPSDGNWKQEYFRKDEIGLEHVQSAAFLLLQRVGGEEGEILKKSESSLEVSLEKDQD